jgi:hypothetical protein
LKPLNIFFKGNVAKIGDFGLSKQGDLYENDFEKSTMINEETKDTSSKIYGTYGFMDPTWNDLPKDEKKKIEN